MNKEICERITGLLLLFLIASFSVLWCTRNVGAAPADWVRFDKGLTLTSSATSAPHLFSFDRWLYVKPDADLYVQLYNHDHPCFGWQKVSIPSGTGFFKPVGDHLYSSGTDLWWAGLGGYATLPIWNKVSSTGLPDSAIIRPQVIFKGQLYAVLVTMSGTFDIYRTLDIGKTSMVWTKVVSAGFGDSQNNDLGGIIKYNGKLIAVTTLTRTSMFGDCSGFGHGIQVWESSTGDLNSWTQVNQDGFGTETTYSCTCSVNSSGKCVPDPPITIRTNQDFGSAVVYNGYLYIGTLSHVWHSGEVWRYDGNGLSGWKDVTPVGMCSGMLGCSGPSRANAMIVYNNLLYLGEGVSTGNLETFDGQNWTMVVGSETSDPIMGHPFAPANIGISSLAVLPSLPTSSGGSTGNRLFALTTTLGGAQIWGYPFSSMPSDCTNPLVIHKPKRFTEPTIYWKGGQVPISQIHLPDVCPRCGFFLAINGRILDYTFNTLTGEVLKVMLSSGQVKGYSWDGKAMEDLPFEVGFTRKQGNLGGDTVLLRMLDKGNQIKGIYLDGNNLKGLILDSKDVKRDQLPKKKSLVP